MLVHGTHTDALPTSIATDASTRLPLLSQQAVVLRLILAYLPLPYSVAEFGCGKKTSITLWQLLEMGVPAYALSRGIIMERDMSPEALARLDFQERPHAMTLTNPLCRSANLNDPTLRAMLRATADDIELGSDTIIAPPYQLRHADTVQFAIARSHVFPMITFWDAERQREAVRIVDPTVASTHLLRVEEMRARLHAPEAWIFTAPMLGRFRLDPRFLTAEQHEEPTAVRACLEFDPAEHASGVRELNGAKPGSIGDPATWTYANNILIEAPRDVAIRLRREAGSKEHEAEQLRNTGAGESLRAHLRAIVDARCERSSDVPERVDQAGAVIKAIHLHEVMEIDARWSERELAPLADLASTVSYFNTAKQIADELKAGGDVLSYVGGEDEVERIRGVGAVLRRSIDELALVSKDERGVIDCRALGDRYLQAAKVTLRQMTRAGLRNYVDAVGNLHGLLLDDVQAQRLSSGEATLAEVTRDALCHASHLDTVLDAGKYDGRLGVLSGILTARLISDLKTYFDVDCQPRNRVLLCTAFCGAKMTFTGEGISMPGSAAVAGRAGVANVHAMRNGDGYSYAERLSAFLGGLAQARADGEVEFENDVPTTGPDGARFDACSSPSDFFTPHTFERHIEQGPVLDRCGVPVALACAVMGIRQEDFCFDGNDCEPAMLEMIATLRELSMEERFSRIRVTVGRLQKPGEARCYEGFSHALRWRVEGKKNHAGATATLDRRDSGVALGRLARAFRSWVERTNEARARTRRAPIEYRIGDVALLPGTDRDVIPGAAVMTLGVRGEDFSSVDAKTLERDLQAFAIGTLAKPMEAGGEGIGLCRADPTSFINGFRSAQLSVDLRGTDSGEMTDFRAAVEDLSRRLQRRFDVVVESQSKHELGPQALDVSGQVLLVERSYGGSHNPDELELPVDLVRGSLVQFAVTLRALSAPKSHDFRLYPLARDALPARWNEAVPRFVSGALHDTCNIAAAARRS